MALVCKRRVKERLVRGRSFGLQNVRGSPINELVKGGGMFEQTFKNIDDVLWKEAGCTTELDYTEQTSWILFLKYLDGLEQDKADEAALPCTTRNTASSWRSRIAGKP